MPKRTEMEIARVRDRIENGDPLWPGQLAVACAIALNLPLEARLTIGPNWLLPGIEALLLVALIVLAPYRATTEPGNRRRLALVLIALVSLTYVVSLGLLAHYLVAGGRTGGHRLILSGIELWLTNVLLFAVWFWELDRGGPGWRSAHPDMLPDLQFPQMENPQFAPKGWRPGFVDYLYTSLTNASAFSPTDTMPLTQTAKMVMALQSVSALVTVGLVVARAVNILA